MAFVDGKRQALPAGSRQEERGERKKGAPVEQGAGRGKMRHCRRGWGQGWGPSEATWVTCDAHSPPLPDDSRRMSTAQNYLREGCFAPMRESGGVQPGPPRARGRGRKGEGVTRRDVGTLTGHGFPAFEGGAVPCSTVFPQTHVHPRPASLALFGNSLWRHDPGKQ